MNHLISNPPRYELEDGSIQIWRGMPKLPDVVNVMLDNRGLAVIKAQKIKGEKEKQEQALLEKRRAEHPEEFFGIVDLAKEFINKFKMSEISDNNRREKELEKQKQQLLENKDAS